MTKDYLIITLLEFKNNVWQEVDTWIFNDNYDIVDFDLISKTRYGILNTKYKNLITAGNLGKEHLREVYKNKYFFKKDLVKIDIHNLLDKIIKIWN